jgi:hypothetical protein
MKLEDVKPGMKVRITDTPDNGVIAEGGRTRLLRIGDVVTVLRVADKHIVYEYQSLAFGATPQYLDPENVEPATEEPTAEEKHKCHCPLQRLLMYGCKCGGV